MLVSDFISKVNYALRATDDDAPTSGTDEYTYWLSALNSKKNELYQDIAKRWNAAFKLQAPNEPGTVATNGTTTLTGTDTYFTDYQVGDKITVSGETERTIATITSDTSLTVTVAFSNTASGKTFTHKNIIKTGVESYSLHRSFLGLSDKVYVLDTNGNTHWYEKVDAPERSEYSRYVFVSGMNPETITFTSDIASTETIVGGELVVPGYYIPDDVTEDTDYVPLPDPYWGVAAVAAELAYNDLTYEDKAEGLNNKATYLYKLMVKKNNRGTATTPQQSNYKIKRIRDTRR